MKNLFITLALILGLSLVADAQQGGLFGKGPMRESYETQTQSREGGLMLPSSHGETGDQSGDAPLGTGTAIFLGLGAAYLVSKKRREE
jgi:LPXTG-motif cell wall-anchored protein